MMCAHGLTVPVHSFCQGQPAADAVKWISSYLPAEAEKRAISRCGMASRTGSRPPSARRVLTLPAPFKPEDCTIALAIRPAPNPPDLTPSRRTATPAPASDRAPSPARSDAAVSNAASRGRGMRGIRRASTPSVEQWQFRSRAETPASLYDEGLSAASTSSGVTPWLRKSYKKYNFGQKSGEPFAIATGLGGLPHRLERQSPISYDITRNRFKHYSRQMQQAQQGLGLTRDMLRSGERSSFGTYQRPYSATSEATRTEIRTLRHEIDQLRNEIRSKAMMQAAGQTAPGRRRTGLLYGGRAYAPDFCD